MAVSLQLSMLISIRPVFVLVGCHVPEQMTMRMEACRELLRLFADGGNKFLEYVVAGDESWLHHYDREAKQGSTVCKSPGSPKTKKGESCSICKEGHGE